MKPRFVYFEIPADGASVTIAFDAVAMVMLSSNELSVLWKGQATMQHFCFATAADAKVIADGIKNEIARPASECSYVRVG